MVEVVALVVQGHRHVERMPGDHDVGGLPVQRYSIERGMGLDEPAMLLGRQPRIHLVAGCDQPVQPR
jgi:hypothetical protein